jgi:signal transduction histidine kinase
MRLALVRLALAITTMVALAFLVPLAMVANEIARQRAIADAQHDADALVAALAVSASLAGCCGAGGDDAQLLDRAVVATRSGVDQRLAVHLPGQPPIGVTHAAQARLDEAAAHRRSLVAPDPQGVVYLQAVALDGGRTAVIEVFVPQAELKRGVHRAWLALTLLAVVLVAGSTALADRLGARIVRGARQLADGARAFGGGDLTTRVRVDGPPELREAADSFNAMAERMVAFVDAERELAADLSHRLRTPLTALRLDADAIPPGPIADRMRETCDALDNEIEEIITSARRSSVERASEQTDLVDVVADRLAFWAVLAEDQQRPWQVIGGAEPVYLPVPRADLIAAVDAMLGNVFEHTPEATGFEVWVSARGLIVDDAGPGIADPQAAVRRGASGSGSTGLGLDIVRRVATAAGGRVSIDRSPLGGARVALLLEPGGNRLARAARRGR